MDRAELARYLRTRLIAGCTAVNTVGAALVFVYLAIVFPPEEASGPFQSTWATGLVVLAYMGLAAVIATRRTQRSADPLYHWLAGPIRPPSGAEARAVLALPKHIVTVNAWLWLAGIVVFVPIAAPQGAGFALEVGVSIFLAGLTTSAAVFLASEWILRPAVGLVLSASAPPEEGALGIGPRILLTWLLCCAVPLIMLALVPVGRLPAEPEDLVAPIWFIVAVGLVSGFVATKVVAHAIARPIRAVRRAQDAVGDGDVGVTVAVDDGSEIGRLQAGFNAMVQGLAERERLRDLFGRQVGIDVAREALERGVALGGESRVVSVLFVDVIGSTTLANREEPQRVVALLNRFFGEVVAAMTEHGGSVDKFEGDAALCVFGAPVACEDHAARALGAARTVRRRLDALREDTGLDAAVGVSGGTVVAGNVGTESRFEWTVIGDPVNEASRLTELAKTTEDRVLASAATLEAAGAPEAGHWEPCGEVVLRGRSAPTPLARPRAADDGQPEGTMQLAMPRFSR